MFRTKKDVDAHVRDIFSKCPTENDRLKICFGIAKQYAGIKEFVSARRYLDTFLACNPPNAAEAKKLMGDIHLELGDEENALEYYKSSYFDGKARDSLNRVCDLLTKGYGKEETAESKKKWFDLQKSSANSQSTTITSTNIANSPITSRLQPMSGGPPKSGFGHTTFVNGGSTPIMASTNKLANNNGNGAVDLQLRYLERRLDDGLGKILDQNTLVLEQMLKLKDDLKDLGAKVEQIALAQQNVQVELLVEKQKQEAQRVAESTHIKNELERLSETCGKVLKKIPKDGFNIEALKVHIEKSLQSLKIEATPKPEKTQLVNKTVVDGKPQIVVENKPLSQMFKKPEGNWDCTICYVSNVKDASKCVACNTIRPGSNPPKEIKPEAPPTALPLFNFGFTENSNLNSINSTYGTITPAANKPITSTAIDTTPKKPEETKDPGFGVLNLSGKLSFADLAKPSSTPTFSFGINDNKNAFNGTGTPLFSSIPSSNTVASSEKTKANTSANHDEGDDEFVPTAEFQPVIPLPPLVEVKKGDEDENMIVEYRAKLYRFINDTKEWKERGIGNIKLLQSKDNPGKCRVVMWREKVGKLACNFNLFSGINVSNYQGNPKVLCWKCHDFTEDPAWELFTCRFGNEDSCTHFKMEMERLAKECVANLNTSTNEADSTTPKKSEVKVEAKPVEPKPDSNKAKSLSQLFKKPEGNWDCTICYVNNSKDSNKCVACSTYRPGFDPPAETIPEVAAPAQPMFSFGFPTPGQVPTFGTSTPLFTNPPTAPAKVNVDPSPDKPEEAKDSPFATLNLSGKFSFADLAKTNNTNNFSFGITDNKNAFSGAGTPLFNSVASANNSAVSGDKNEKSTANTSVNQEEGDDEFVPTAEFQPVIPLPPLVEVKKGDEDENMIVEYRAKLYRFINDTKEWKERGIGNIKLLQSKDNPGKCRVVMWREKVGKLACNFNLFSGINVSNYQGNPKVLCWKCHDFTEDPSWELFTCRFGNEDSCTHFKMEMERLAKECVPNLNTSTNEADSTTPEKSEVKIEVKPTESKPDSDKTKPLSQLFKKPEGNWDCNICYVSNSKDANKCVACCTNRPGFDPPAEATPEVAAPTQPMFSFGFPTPAQVPTFGTTTPLFTNPPPAKVTTDPSPEKPEEAKDSPFATLNLAGKFSFADLASKTSNTNFSFGTTDTKNSFSGAGTPLFSSIPSANTSAIGGDPEKSIANTSVNEGDDEFVPTAEFQPVIPLPPIVEVKKGDENENLIVEHRAKLYRFVNETKEWKERGVGNIKILQSKDNPGKCRVVMWREKIGKLACNFNLYSGINITYYQGNQKVLCWKCHDFAEDPAWELFTCRFGNEDNCAQIKNEMERLAKECGSGSGNATQNSPVVAKTESPSCSGCIGCEPDAFKFPQYDVQHIQDNIIDIPLTAESSIISSATSSDAPFVVSLEWFQSNNDKAESKVVEKPDEQIVPEIIEVAKDSNSLTNNQNLSSFSFSLSSSETTNTTSSPTSFSFKSPSFSFKSPENNSSPSIFGNSIFSSPLGGTTTASTIPSFTSPFAQQPVTTSIPNASMFTWTAPGVQPSAFQPTEVPHDFTNVAHREEDEYEDVDDEEDECMFEDDAHIFIQEDPDSTADYEDKGQGVVRVLYDGESYCARLVVVVNEEIIAEHLVAADTQLTDAGTNTSEWIGVCDFETPAKTRIKAVFNDEDAHKSFGTVMTDSLEFAEQAGITEEALLENFSDN